MAETKFLITGATGRTGETRFACSWRKSTPCACSSTGLMTDQNNCKNLAGGIVQATAQFAQASKEAAPRAARSLSWQAGLLREIPTGKKSRS